MKRILIFLFLLCTYTFASAQKIHWITFIDTTDDNVGEIDVRGREVLYSHFINVVNAALAPEGYTPVIHDYYGSNTSPENCKYIVNNLTCSPEDIIVFYYIGHGARSLQSSTGEFPWPQMLLAQHSENYCIPLEWVGKQLANKGARLSITIGMCCNSESAGLRHRVTPTFAPNFGTTYVSSNKVKAIQQLFLGQKGNILATSASPKQTSGCLDFKKFDVIDAYSGIICALFDNEIGKNTDITLDSFFNEIKDAVNYFTSQRQTPFHKSNLTKAAKPAPKSKAPDTTKKPVPKKETQTAQQQKPGNSAASSSTSANKPSSSTTSSSTAANKPKPAPATQAKEEDPLQIIDEWFTTLVAKSTPASKRISYAEAMAAKLKYVEKVKIISQDGNVVIDSDDIDTYVRRIATSSILLKSIPVSLKTESGKMVLRVKEVYKN